MRLTKVPKSEDRCPAAIQLEAMATRCMFRRGHNGPHEGKGWKRLIYSRHRWFEGDERAFRSEHDGEWAWRQRPRDAGDGGHLPVDPDGGSGEPDGRGVADGDGAGRQPVDPSGPSRSGRPGRPDPEGQ